jgi:hypothetical protein
MDRLRIDALERYVERETEGWTFVSSTRSTFLSLALVVLIFPCKLWKGQLGTELKNADAKLR